MKRRDLREFMTGHFMEAEYKGFILVSKVLEKDGGYLMACDIVHGQRLVVTQVLQTAQPPKTLKAALKRAERFGRQQGTAYVDLLLATARQIKIEEKAEPTP